jgi:hypothetical protein
MLRRIFRPKRHEMIAGWRKLHNEELHNSRSLPNTGIIRMIKSRSMGWVTRVARTGKTRNGYRILVRKPEGKRPLGKSRHRCEDNIKIYLGETERGGIDWIDVAQDRDQWMALVNTVMNLRVP